MYENIDWKENDPYYPKKSNSTRIIILCIVCSILAGALGAGCVYFYSSTPPSVSSQITKSSRSSPAPTQVSAGNVMTPAQVYAQNVNSTVGITTAVSINYWGYPSTAAASGSGFILTQNGYVLTNYHVVEGSDSISVSCYDGTTYQARLVSSDPSKVVAILNIEAEDLTPVVFGNSADLCVGDPVVAIGNALGFDPIHFGVLMVIIMQLGAITPPVGTFLFISCGVAKLPMEQSVKPLLPYIATVIIIFILGFLVPEIVTWLPGLIYG